MKMKQRGFLLILAAFLVFSLAGVSFGQGDIFVKGGVGTVSKQKWASGEIIVKFKAGISQDVISQANQTHGCSVLSVSKRGKFHRLGISKNRTVEEMVTIYNKNPNVEYAEPNFIASALFTPDDPLYPYQWHLHNSSGGITGGINMESAWDIPPQGGVPEVVVAVIDTGVAYEDYGVYKLAPDLANTAFVQGYDFINNDSHPNDDNSHGTHVTGTIAQSTNNSLGTAGIAFNTAIMPVKVLDSNGSGTYVNIVDGIYFAADNGANVINMSLGGPGASSTLESALAYAHDVKGVTIVCAAGNGFEDGNSTFYPAAYDDYCIAVGATRYDETRSYYSNTGTYLDIAAPGGDVTVNQNGDSYGDGILQQTFQPAIDNFPFAPTPADPTDFGYWFFQGTSMATPHVAGVAALLIAKGGVTATGPEDVREALESTAKKPPCVDGQCGNEQCWSEEYGWGILDAAAALNYSPQPVSDVAVCGISTPSPVFEGDVSVSVTVANPGTSDETFTVTLYDNNVLVDMQSVSLPARETANLTFIWSAVIGDHTLRAEADLTDTNTANNSIVTTVTVQDSSAQDGQDVEVLSLTAPSEVTKGGPNVNVTARIVNNGSSGHPLVEGEYITVSLYDVTDGRQIDESLLDYYLLASPWVLYVDVTFPWDITNNASIGMHELRVDVTTASADPVPGNNSMETTVTVQESTGQGQDVEVTGLIAPSEVTIGEPVNNIVNVIATIVNNGSSSEDITVSLYDVTDGQQIDGSLNWSLGLLVELQVTFDWDITDASIGTHELRVDVATASIDPVPENNSMTAYTTVNGGINQPPVFTSTPLASATEGTAYTYNITTNDADTGDTLVLSAPVLPAWLTLTDNGNRTGLLTGTPVNADVGTHNVTLRVTDGVAFSDQIFVITVANDNGNNQAPVVNFVSPTDGATVSGNVSIEVTAIDDDLILIELYVDYGGSNQELISTSTTSPLTYTWKTRKVSLGDYTLTAIAYDRSGNMVFKTINIELIPKSGGGGSDGGKPDNGKGGKPPKK